MGSTSIGIYVEDTQVFYSIASLITNETNLQQQKHFSLKYFLFYKTET